MPQLMGDGAGESLVVRTAKAGRRDRAAVLSQAGLERDGDLKFTIPATAAKADANKPFYRAKEYYYSGLMARNIPGAAWFRHEVRQAQMAQNKTPAELAPGRTSPRPRGGFPATATWSTTYALFSGGRAVERKPATRSRTVQGTKPEEATVDIDTIEGITVPEIDWKPLVKDLKPELDPLAASIPADQHVVFFPDVFGGRADGRPGRDARHADPAPGRAAFGRRPDRRALPAAVVPLADRARPAAGAEGGEERGPDRLRSLLPHRHRRGRAVRGAEPRAAGEPAAGPDRDGVEPKRRTPSRSRARSTGWPIAASVRPTASVCSYVARLDHAVVVTNSLYQLERLAAVAKKKSPSIASLPEYVFFRDRYRLGDPEETALVFLSDATIRRWCGPRWRIATSRQTRDMAVLAELQAANMDRLAKKTAQPGPIYTDFATAEVGELSLDAEGVHSSVQGSLEFMTPIAEMPLRKVTKSRGRRLPLVARRLPAQLALGVRSDRAAADAATEPAGGRPDRDAADLRHRVSGVRRRFPKGRSSPPTPATRTTPWSTSSWRSTRSRRCSPGPKTSSRRCRRA